MNFLNNLLPQVFIHSLGWTIVHSLWQGIAFAILLDFVLFFMKKSASKSRYIVSVTFSILLFALAIITFINYSNSYEPQIKGNYFIESNKTDNINIGNNVIQESYYSKTKDLFESVMSWSSQYHNYMTAIWLSGAIILLLKFLSGLVFQKRLRNKSFSLDSDLQTIVDNTIRKLGYKSSISIAESLLAKTPMVIGYFKPIILLPIGIFTGLSNEQIELILAHEIAHIMRKDYFINIFLMLTEIVFFYNPAFWWISSKIKFERECSCDDLAISLTNYPFAYAKALAAVLENSFNAPHYSLALFNKKSHALKRIERIINPSRMQPSSKEGFIVVIGLLLSLFITVSAKVNASHFTNHSSLILDSNLIQSNDSLKNGKTILKPIHESNKPKASTNIIKSVKSSDEFAIRKIGTGNWDGQGVSTDKGTYKHVTLEWKNDIVTRLAVNGEEINPKDFRNYLDLIYFDLNMPSLSLKKDAGKKDEGSGAMSAGELTIGNKTYYNVKLNWKNYTPTYLVVEGKEIDKADYDKYSDLINSHVQKRPSVNPEIK
ncbi:MAG: M56 family metallopeptidase [Bacteroidota bacterium]|nr:M56 family metallopeptidase [Bacteroidota bacterium]